MSDSAWIAQVADNEERLKMAATELKELTPEKLLGLFETIQHLEDQGRVPEALGSASTYMRGPGGAEILVVARGVSIDAAWKDLEAFVIDRIKQKYQPVIKYPIHNGGGEQQAGTPQTKDRVELPMDRREIAVVKMDISPREDNRVDIDFYAANRKWPDLKIVNWKNEDVLKMLEPTGNWDNDDLSKKKSLTVSMRATWEPSEKLNSKGEPYKNIKSLAPIDS